MKISEFEKLLVSEQLVETRNRAGRVSSYIKANLQGTSHEAFAALIPGLRNDGIAPSNSIAMLIVILAQKVEW